MLPIDNFVSHHCFAIKMLVEIIVCHEDMTGKRGGENVAGMNILPFWNRVFNVLVGKPFITRL